MEQQQGGAASIYLCLGRSQRKTTNRSFMAFEGRRLNFSKPEQSLLLRKALGELEHGGGEIVELNSSSYQRLLQWIKSGSKRYAGDRNQSRNLVAFEVALDDEVLNRPNQTTGIKAVAVYEDGEREDVFEWTTFIPHDPSAVRINPAEKTLSVSRPGQHIIVARFLNRVVPIQVSFPFATNDSPQAKLSSSQDSIDIPINRGIELMGLSAASPATDAVFLRRVTLDLTGRLPSHEEALRFLSNDSAYEARNLSGLASS